MLSAVIVVVLRRIGSGRTIFPLSDSNPCQLPGPWKHVGDLPFLLQAVDLKKGSDSLKFLDNKSSASLSYVCSLEKER